MAAESDFGAEAEKFWTVSYRLGPDDLMAFHRLQLKVGYGRAPIYVALLIVVLGAGLGWLIGVAADRSRPLSMIIGAGSGLILYRALLRSAQRRTLRQGELGGHFTEQTLKIMPEGFEHTFQDGRTMFRPWRTVRKLGQVRAPGNTRSYFVILYEDAGVIVPLDAFESDLTGSIFRAAADQWHTKARGSDAPSS